MDILLIEDDPEAAAYIADGLRGRGHAVDQASDGHRGVALAQSRAYGVLIVDRMLPGLDGLAIVKILRASGSGTPILFLTAIDGVDDRVDGLEAGGDDYLVKPFSFSELSARIDALARRPPLGDDTLQLLVGDLRMDMARRVVSRGDRAIDLQPREFRLLHYLMRHHGQVVTRTMLLEHVWDFHFDPRTTVVETLISRLRGKLGDGQQALIETVRGAGYRLRDATALA